LLNDSICLSEYVLLLIFLDVHSQQRITGKTKSLKIWVKKIPAKAGIFRQSDIYARGNYIG
jgi:hypothetical protein